MDRALLQATATGLLTRGLLGLPAPVLRALAGTPPAVARDLEPEAWLLARLATLADRLAGEPPPVERARRLSDAQSRFLAAAPRTPVGTEDREAGGVAARLYAPAGAGRTSPLLVFFHGGGWVNRSVASHDAPCRLLAHLAGVRILSVEYRRAPEHPFPAAADDCLAAYAAVAGDPEAFGALPGRIGVGGDSAGGNLAAATALCARDGGLPPPALQWLLYPVTDCAGRHPSQELFSEGFYLTDADMDAYIAQYLPEAGRRRDPRASPLLAPSLEGLPPAYIATALADPLRDEGEAFGARLLQAGVRADVQRFPLVHGFLNVTVAPSAREAVGVTAGALRAGLR